VSVTSPNWQDEHFASILDFAAEHFKVIRIDVTDLLYRHNFMAEGLSPTDAQAQASALGALWLARHQPIINACAVRPEVIRWGQWYDHADYGTVLYGFRRACAESPTLRAAIESDVEGFFRRQQRTPTDTDRQHSRESHSCDAFHESFIERFIQQPNFFRHDLSSFCYLFHLTLVQRACQFGD